MSRGDYASGGASMFELLRDLEVEGYTGDMASREGGDVVCRSCGTTSPAGRFAATSVHRAEGASDPDDMVAVVGLTCPVCGARGVLVAHYGADMSVEDAEVLRALDTHGAGPGDT